MATTNAPYVDEAIERLRNRTQQTRAAMADVQPGSGANTQVNDTTKRPRGIINRAKSAAGKTAKFGLKRGIPAVAAADAVADSAAPDSTARYAERFGMDEPTGDGSWGDMGKFALLRTLGFASDLGDSLTLGTAGNFYRDKDMPSAPGGNGGGNGPVQNANAAEPGSQPPDQMRQPEQPAGQDGERMPAADGEVDLGDMLDDPKFIPGRGTGIIRNQRTGKTQAVAGEPDQPQQQQATVQQEEQPTNRQVDMPNLALAMDASTLPQYLAQFSTATQQAADNRRRTANRKGIIARQKGRQDIAKGEQDLTKGEVEIGQLEQLDQVLSELHTLDDSNDPQGNRRAELTEMALTLQGKKPGDRFDFKTMKDVDPETFAPIQKVVRVNPRTGKAQLVDPNAQQGGQTGDVAKPTTEQEYNALPSGAMFVDPEDGKTYRKP